MRVALLIAMACGLCAQQAALAPADFELVSIKAHNPEQPGGTDAT